MVSCHLARLMDERKMRIADVVRKTGLNHNAVTLLYKETAKKIDLEALENYAGYLTAIYKIRSNVCTLNNYKGQL